MGALLFFWAALARAEPPNDHPSPIVRVAAAIGPAWWITQSVCGGYSGCPEPGVVLSAEALLRVAAPISVGASIARHSYGVVTPSYPLVALSTHSLTE